MKHLYKLLILILTLPVISIAQSNYKPGLVVNLKGDTVHGFIDLRDWAANPETISFKTSLGDPAAQSFTVADISFFTAANTVTYQRFTCSISMNDINTQNLGTVRDTTFRTGTVFLQVLQKGKNVALYSYTDRLKTRYYIGEAPGYSPTELIYRVYSTGGATDRNGNTVNENTYQKQLFAIAAKYNALDNDLTNLLQSANYNYPNLLDAVSKINNISEKEYKKNYNNQTKVRFYVAGGANIANIRSNSSSQYTLAGGPGSQTSFQPMAALGVNLIPRPATDRFEIRLEVGVNSAKYDAAYKLTVSPYVPVKVTFNQLGISIAPQIVYNLYSADNLKIYIGAGIAFFHFSYSNAFFGSQDPKVSDGGVGAANPFYFNSSDDAFILKAGVRIGKNVEIFGNYLSNTAITQGGYFQMVNSTGNVGLIYLFGK
jgi:hypothetical protein